jgi:hypothetical protein
MTAPDKVWAWCFQVSTDGDWGGWGGYARQTNLHPLDDRERATGAEYTRSDLIAQSNPNTRVVTVNQLERWMASMPHTFKSHKEIRAIIGEVK